MSGVLCSSCTRLGAHASWSRGPSVRLCPLHWGLLCRCRAALKDVQRKIGRRARAAGPSWRAAARRRALPHRVRYPRCWPWPWAPGMLFLVTRLGRWRRGRFAAPGGIFNPYVPPEECAWLLAVVPSRAAGWDGAGSGDRLHDGVFLLNAFQAYLKYLWLVF